jgi:DNA-binding response OmpR family regulator
VQIASLGKFGESAQLMVKRSVLIVEDDPELSILFAEVLGEMDVTAQIERDGSRVHGRIHELRPDLVILDLHLPRMSGLDILDAIRNDARIRQPKVLIITSNPQLAKTAAAKADIALIKPVGFDQLLNTVERLIGSATRT